MVYPNQFWCLPRWEKYKWQKLFSDSQTHWVKKSFSFSKTLNKSSPLVTISFPTWRWLEWNLWSTVPDLSYQKHKIRSTCIFIKSCSDYRISLHIYIHSNVTALLEGYLIKLHDKPTNNICVSDCLKENFYFPSDSLKLL